MSTVLIPLALIIFSICFITMCVVWVFIYRENKKFNKRLESLFDENGIKQPENVNAFVGTFNIAQSANTDDVGAIQIKPVKIRKQDVKAWRDYQIESLSVVNTNFIDNSTNN